MTNRFSRICISQVQNVNSSPFSPVLDLLERAISRLERGWCQGPFALDFEGFGTVPTSPEACAWCAVGSMQASRWEDPAPSLEGYCALRDFMDHELINLFPEERSASLIFFNEHPSTTGEDVLYFFRHIRHLLLEEASA